ncbi:Beta-glucoside bgl operon antiterminator,BglGfamily [Enterococcus sp. HSIEG1]|nr:Beta-glucoside bgl operon antiterminator,BglGfamily [Enterococcus sp. HSIEG1]
MIYIKKVLNSSVVLVDNEGQEMIALGKGIGFGKKAGEQITDSQIDQVFLPIDETRSLQFAELIDEIPIRFFEMTKEIVQLAQQLMPNPLNSTIYLTLSDHLHFAVERQEKGLSITNRLYWEIKNYYAKEYAVAEQALLLLREKYQIFLPEEEA